MSLTSSWKIDGNEVDVDPTTLREMCLLNGYPTDVFDRVANSFHNVRGRLPSRGYVLLTGTMLTKLGPLKKPIHTLTISDGSNTVTFSKLAIIRTRAVACSMPGIEYTPGSTSAYLCELVDARHFATWTSTGDDVRKSVRQPSQLPNPTLPYPVLFQELWKGVAPLLGGVNDTASYPSGNPSNLYQDNACGWDSVTAFCDHLNHTLYPSANGFTCSDILSEPDASLKQKLKDARPYLIDAEPLPTESFTLPAKIVVNTFSLNAQYQTAPGNHVTYQDLWRDKPGYTFTYGTAALLPQAAPHVIPGTSFPIWIPFDYKKDDSGNDNLRTLEPIAKSHARDILKSFHTHWSNLSYLFSGVHDFTPDGYLSAVTHFDIGQGVQTKAAQLPVHPTDPDFAPTPGGEWFAPPDNARHHIPHERLIVGKYNASGVSKSCFVLKPTIKVNQNLFGLPHKEKGLFDLYYHQEKKNKLEPTPFASVEAYNILGTLIPFDHWCFLRFNYQPGEEPAGRWTVVAIAPIFTTWQADCIPPAQVIETSCTLFPNLITVRKDSGLRLIKRVEPFPADSGIREAIIDLKGGPANTVYIGRGLDEPLGFSSAPTLNQVQVTGGIRFLKGNVSSLLLGPKLGKIKLRLPNEENAVPGALLAVKAPGPCVETEWIKPGISTVFSFSGWNGEDCTGAARCITLTYERGILVSARGVSLKPSPIIKGTDCPLPIPPVYLHCELPKPPPPESPGLGNLIQ